MADKKEYINWFLAEIPLLADKGIIPDETAAALTGYYDSKLKGLPSSRNIYALVLGVIGIIMAVAGVILFLNYNWDMFPKVVRIGLAATPLFLGAVTAYLTIFSGKGQVWKEASAILTSAGAATLIAVLSQIYHTGGELAEFMFLVSLLSLPLIYIFNSIGLATLYCFFTFFVLGRHGVPWWNSLLIALILPYIFYHLRKNSSWCVWCRYQVIAVAISLFAGSAVEVYGTLPAIQLCSIFIIAGMDLLKSGTATSGKNPWLLPAFVVQTILLAVGSSTKGIFRCDLDEKTVFLWTYGIVNGLLFLGYLLLFFRKRITFERVASLLLIVLTAIPLIAKKRIVRISSGDMQVFYNFYMGIYGIALIYYGIKRGSLLIFNGGVITLGVLTACRFFDSDIGLLYRSIGFMVLGIGFLLANWLFVKFSRETEK